MTMRKWSFEVAPAGTALTTGNLVSSDSVNALIVGAITGTGTVTSSSSNARVGFYSGAFANNASSGVIARLPFAASHDAGAISFYHYVAAAPSALMPIVAVRHSSGVCFRVGLSNTNRPFISDSTGTTVATATAAITFGQLNRWEIVYNRAAGSCTVNVYAGDATSSPLATVTTTGQSFTANPIVSLDIGSPVAVTPAVTQFIDLVSMDDGRTTEIGPPTLSPPTVTCGPNQNVSAGDAVSVTSTAVDSDGTVVTRQWSFDYPTSGAPALTGSTTATASFTAGPAGSLYILRHTATDNDGTPASATTEVRVPTAAEMTPLPTDGTGSAGWTNVGGAATQGAALADASDATYIESDNVSSTEQTRRFRVLPSPTRTGAQITVRVSQDAAGALTAKARLYEGSTLRQEWTVPVTTTPATQTLTLSAGTLAAIGDWGNLSLKIAATS